MKLALVAVLSACSSDVPSTKVDADTANIIATPDGTYWETMDFHSDTKLQLAMNGGGMESDPDHGATQTFAWDALTPTSIEIFSCQPAPCVLTGLIDVQFSTADKLTAKVPPDNATVTSWTLVHASTFP